MPPSGLVDGRHHDHVELGQDLVVLVREPPSEIHGVPVDRRVLAPPIFAVRRLLSSLRSAIPREAGHTRSWKCR